MIMSVTDSNANCMLLVYICGTCNLSVDCTVLRPGSLLRHAIHDIARSTLNSGMLIAKFVFKLPLYNTNIS